MREFVPVEFGKRRTLWLPVQSSRKKFAQRRGECAQRVPLQIGDGDTRGTSSWSRRLSESRSIWRERTRRELGAPGAFLGSRRVGSSSAGIFPSQVIHNIRSNLRARFVLCPKLAIAPYLGLVVLVIDDDSVLL